MTTCFKCGKVLPGNLCPGEYVMCKECDEKWRKTEERINKDVIEQMMNDVIKLKPFGWVFLPHPKEHDPLTIEIDKKRIVLCKDCKYKPTRNEEGFEDFPVCGKCPLECVDDPYYSRMPDDNWFCANGEERQ